MTMTEGTAPGKELTGRKVLIIAVSAFSVIIGVNLFMAYSSISTFPGLEVANSYVASQTFDEDRAAQEALGWNALASASGDTLRVEITDADGLPAAVAEIGGLVGRTTERQHDQPLTFTRAPSGAHVAEIEPLAPGKWEVRLEARATDGTLFRQRLILRLTEG
ncbi:FixH family protein [Maritimibacter fusiformis]